MKKSICFLFAIKLGICFFCFFFLSCEEEFKVDMPDNIANGIVFRGLISSGPPPYFFQLTKPAAMSAEKYYYEGIEDAEIVIEDVTAGIKDTILKKKKALLMWNCIITITGLRKWNMSH